MMSSIVLDKAGAPLRIFVLRRRALSLSGRAVVEIISRPAIPAHAVLVMQTDVEPDRRIERAMLVHAKPGQLVVENFRLLRIGKITIRDPPVRDRPRDAVHQLLHRTFAPAFARISPIRYVAIKIFRDRDLGRQSAPALGHLDVLLFEDHPAAIVGDFRRAPLPVDLVEGRRLRVAKHALEAQSLALLFTDTIFHSKRRFARAVQRGWLDSVFELDHGGGRGGWE
jgi:hypothetical protein